MDFRLPELGEGVYEAELIRWLVRPGDGVTPGQNLLEVMTDKATMEVPAPFTGIVTATIAAPGQPIKVGDIVLSYNPAIKVDVPSADPGPEPHPELAELLEPDPRHVRPEPETRNGAPNHPATGSGPIKAGPAVRQLARKLGIDLTQIHGTGPQGRILLEDLILPSTESSTKKTDAKKDDRDERLPKLDLGRPGERIKNQGLRRKIAEHMLLSKQKIPHFSYVDECDVSDLVRLRGSLRTTFGKAGLKLTYLAFLVRAAALALKDVPLVNSSLDEASAEIVLHDHRHVGIAVATPQGLIVPIIRDADRKDIPTLAGDIERLSREARDGRSRLDDLRGGTFTVSSIGSIGGLTSAPIINHPEVAVMAVGKIVKRPVFDDNGAVRAAHMVYLSFSFDHRVLDGAVGAVFGNAIVKRLQEPATLLLPEPLTGSFFPNQPEEPDQQSSVRANR